MIEYLDLLFLFPKEITLFINLKESYIDLQNILSEQRKDIILLKIKRIL